MKWMLGLAVAAGLCAPRAMAYEIGGHHDTVHGVLRASTAAELEERDRVLLAFCTLLPDLASDLDAVVLRERVALDFSDWGWGIGEQCHTNTSHQMTVAQFYLHALSGRSVAEFRGAARRLVDSLRSTVGASARGRRRDNALCALGFATHLLGDTFAHSRLRLSEQGQLYETGRGHARDGHQPDFMLSRNFDSYEAAGNRWADWVRLLGDLWGVDTDKSDVKAKGQAVAQERGQGDGAGLRQRETETALTQQLVETGPRWRKEAFVTWPEPSWQSPWKGPTCRSQAENFKQAMPQKDPVDFDCAQVWQLYLEQAETAFGTIRPRSSTCYIRQGGAGPLPRLDGN